MSWRVEAFVALVHTVLQYLSALMYLVVNSISCLVRAGRRSIGCFLETLNGQCAFRATSEC